MSAVEILRTFGSPKRRHGGRIDGDSNTFAMRPDGRQAFFGRSNGRWKILDLETGDEVDSGEVGDFGFPAVAYSPNGRMLLWDRETGRKLAETEGSGQVACAAVSPDGGRALVALRKRMDENPEVERKLLDRFRK